MPAHSGDSAGDAYRYASRRLPTPKTLMVPWRRSSSVTGSSSGGAVAAAWGHRIAQRELQEADGGGHRMGRRAVDQIMGRKGRPAEEKRAARLAGEVNQMIEIASTVQNSEKFTYLKMSEDMSVAAMASVQSQSTTMMANLSQMAQRYPELASNRQFTTAMESVRTCQRDLAVTRQAYNDAAKEYNLTRTSIPHVFYSGLLGFKEAPYLDQQAMKAGDAADRPLIINDDGERINALLRSGGAAAMGATRQLGEQAKLLIEKGAAKATAATPTAPSAAPLPAAVPAPLPPAGEGEYVYLDANMNKQGPVTLSGLAALRGAGVIQPDTKVLHPADQRWVEYREIANS